MPLAQVLYGFIFVLWLGKVWTGGKQLHRLSAAAVLGATHSHASTSCTACTDLDDVKVKQKKNSIGSTPVNNSPLESKCSLSEWCRKFDAKLTHLLYVFSVWNWTRSVQDNVPHSSDFYFKKQMQIKLSLSFPSSLGAVWTDAQPLFFFISVLSSEQWRCQGLHKLETHITSLQNTTVDIQSSTWIKIWIIPLLHWQRQTCLWDLWNVRL